MPFLTNPRREAFAQAYVRGETAGLRGPSYLAAGFKCARGAAGKCAWRLMQDPRVVARIAELQQQSAEAPAPHDGSASAAPPRPMPILSHPQHEAFCQAFVRGPTAGNGGASYLAAGYRCSVKSAGNAAYRLLKLQHVARRIAELKQEIYCAEGEATQRAAERLAITREAVLAELAKIAFSNMKDYWKPLSDGTFGPDLSRIDRDKAAAIQEIIITEAKDGARQRIRLKLASKRDALVDLGRHFGLFVPGSAAEETDEFEGLTDAELAVKIRGAVRELERAGVDVAAEFGIDTGGEAKPKLTH